MAGNVTADLFSMLNKSDTYLNDQTDGKVSEDATNRRVTLLLEESEIANVGWNNEAATSSKIGNLVGNNTGTNKHAETSGAARRTSLLKGQAVNLLPIDENLTFKHLVTLSHHPTGGLFIDSEPLAKALEKLAKCVNENKITIDELLDANDSLADYVEVVEKTVALHETRLANLEENVRNTLADSMANLHRSGKTSIAGMSEKGNEGNNFNNNAVVEAIQNFTNMMQGWMKQQQGTMSSNQSMVDVRASWSEINSSSPDAPPRNTGDNPASRPGEGANEEIIAKEQLLNGAAQQQQQQHTAPQLVPNMPNPMMPMMMMMNPMMVMNMMTHTPQGPPPGMTPGPAAVSEAAISSSQNERNAPGQGHALGQGKESPEERTGQAAASMTVTPNFGVMTNPLLRSGSGMHLKMGQLDPTMMIGGMLSNQLQAASQLQAFHSAAAQQGSEPATVPASSSHTIETNSFDRRSHTMRNSNSAFETNSQSAASKLQKKYALTDEKNIPFSDVIEDLVEWKMKDNERLQKERITDLKNDLLVLSKKLEIERENVRSGPLAQKVNESILLTQTNATEVNSLIRKTEALEKNKSDKVQTENTLEHMSKLMERQEKLESQMELLLPLAEEFAQHGSLSYSTMISHIAELARNFREEMTAFGENVSGRVHELTVDVKKKVGKDEYNSKMKHLDDMKNQIQASIEQDFVRRYTEKKDLNEVHRKIDRALELYQQATNGIRPEEYWGMRVKSPLSSVERDQGNYGYGSPKNNNGTSTRPGAGQKACRDVLPTSTERKQPYSATSFLQQMDKKNKLPCVGTSPISIPITDGYKHSNY